MIKDTEILQLAITGLESQKKTIEEKIAEVKDQLGLTTKSGRKLSPAARKRIADANRKRWAAYRAEKEQTSRFKRTPAQRRRMSAAQCKRHAAIRAAKSGKLEAISEIRKSA